MWAGANDTAAATTLLLTGIRNAELLIAGHHAADLGITGFNLMGGTILDNDGTSPDFSVLFGLATGLTIDTPLTVRSVTTIQSGEESASATVELVVTLSEAVTVATDGGLPTLILSNGATATYDAAASQLSSGKLAFDYIVGPGEGTPDLSALWVTLPSGTTAMPRATTPRSPESSAARPVFRSVLPSSARCSSLLVARCMLGRPPSLS